MRCWGITKRLSRCQHSVTSKWPYCSVHRRQIAYATLILLSGVLASYLAMYIPVWRTDIEKELTIAISELDAGNIDKAINHLSKLYKNNSSYPKVALKYGEALSRAMKWSDAIPVFMNIPANESTSLKKYLIGICFYRLKDFDNSKKYLTESLNELKRNSCRYWAARSLLILINNLNSPIESFRNDVVYLLEVIDNDIARISKFEAIPNTNYEIDPNELENEILGRQSAAFTVLRQFAYKLRETKDHYCDSVPYLIKAFGRLKSSIIGCAFDIDEKTYKEFLNEFGVTLGYCKSRNKDISDVKDYLKKAYNLNVKLKRYQFAECLGMLDFFLLKSETIPTISVSNFTLTYEISFEDNSGLSFLHIYSSKQIDGNVSIPLHGVDKYTYTKKISINSSTKLLSMPIFICKAVDIYGNISQEVEVFPYIEFIE